MMTQQNKENKELFEDLVIRCKVDQDEDKIELQSKVSVRCVTTGAIITILPKLVNNLLQSLNGIDTDDELFAAKIKVATNLMMSSGKDGVDDE